MRTILLVVMTILASCASVQRYQKFDVREGQKLTAYRGQRLVRVKKIEDLPNAFGKKDIYGGKVDKGVTEIYYGGIDKNRVIFYVYDQDIETNANVFTRYKEDTISFNTKRTAEGSSGEITYHEAPKEWAKDLPPDSYIIPVDLTKGRRFKVRSVSVEIIEATNDNIKYIVTKTNDKKIIEEFGDEFN